MQGSYALFNTKTLLAYIIISSEVLVRVNNSHCCIFYREIHLLTRKAQSLVVVYRNWDIAEVGCTAQHIQPVQEDRNNLLGYSRQHPKYTVLTCNTLSCTCLWRLVGTR